MTLSSFVDVIVVASEDRSWRSFQAKFLADFVGPGSITEKMDNDDTYQSLTAMFWPHDNLLTSLYLVGERVGEGGSLISQT